MKALTFITRVWLVQGHYCFFSFCLTALTVASLWFLLRWKNITLVHISFAKSNSKFMVL